MIAMDGMLKIWQLPKAETLGPASRNVRLALHMHGI